LREGREGETRCSPAMICWSSSFASARLVDNEASIWRRLSDVAWCCFMLGLVEAMYCSQLSWSARNSSVVLRDPVRPQPQLSSGSPAYPVPCAPALRHGPMDWLPRVTRSRRREEARPDFVRKYLIPISNCRPISPPWLCWPARCSSDPQSYDLVSIRILRDLRRPCSTQGNVLLVD
jgi:hypothetical protein